MKLIGVALVVLGIVALVYGGIGYSREKTVVDFGGIKATATEHKTIPIAPIVGAISIIGGIAILAGARRRG